MKNCISKEINWNKQFKRCYRAQSEGKR